MKQSLFAVVNATVAEPVAIRIKPATMKANTIGDNEICSAICAIAVPTPLSINICLNPPPAPIIKIIEPTGNKLSSVNF